MSIAPLYILGAKNTDHNKVRFVFIMPTPDSPDMMQGDGALLEIADFRDLVAGNGAPLKPSLLEAYFETLVEGDEESPGRGPIPCGIGLSGDEFQIVEFGSAEPIVSGHGKLFTYLTNIDITTLESSD